MHYNYVGILDKESPTNSAQQRFERPLTNCKFLCKFALDKATQDENSFFYG